MTEPTTHDDAQARAAVEDLIQVLLKGLRAIQLYLPNNPIYQRTCDNVRNAFQPVWEHCSVLDLEVTETDIVWEDSAVLSQANRAESVVWVLFKDGMRSLKMLPGAEGDEIIRFLTAVHQARMLADDAPDDLLTLLWEQEFQSIKYEFLELGTKDAPELGGSASTPTVSAPALRREVEEAAGKHAGEAAADQPAGGEEAADQPAGIVQIDEADSTLYFLDDQELEYLEGEVEREYQQDLRGNVLSVLFDLLETQTYRAVRAEIISILESFIPYLLGMGDFRAVAYVLREIRVVLQRASELLPEHREALNNFPATLSDPEALGQLLQSVDEALVYPTEDELGELFRELRPQALQTLLAWLPKLGSERVRTLLGNAVRRLAQANPEQIAEILKTDDEGIVLQTVRLGGELKLLALVAGLGQLLRGGSTDVRRAVVEALAEMATPSAMKHLESVIADDDRDVRVGAVRAMGSQGYRGAFPKIERAIKRKALRDEDLTEKTAFFEAYGLLAGPSGISMLQPMIEKKGFMRRKADPQTRACVALALGKIATPEAKSILNAVAGDKDPLVRNAVNKALLEIA